MRATSKALDAGTSRAVAEYIASLPRVFPKQTIIVATDAGRELYAERCMECHRYNGGGEFAFGSPPLMGLQDWYLKSELLKFKTGQRGVMKGDVNGQKMAFASGFIEDEETLQSLVAYLVSMQDETAKAKQPPKDPFEQTSASAQR